MQFNTKYQYIFTTVTFTLDMIDIFQSTCMKNFLMPRVAFVFLAFLKGETYVHLSSIDVHSSLIMCYVRGTYLGIFLERVDLHPPVYESVLKNTFKGHVQAEFPLRNYENAYLCFMGHRGESRNFQSCHLKTDTFTLGTLFSQRYIAQC